MAPQRTAGQQCQGPAARTRAAARPQHAADMVLPLLLQHDSIRTRLPLVCKLLCCSKWLAAAVAEHSAGQLDMPRFTEAKAAPWLRKHARLLRSIGTRVYGNDACVAALVAAGPQSLLLQSLALGASDSTLPLLEQLPASRLTHLRFFTHEHSLQLADQAAFVARLSAALGRLTALRSLELQRSPLAAVPGLCGLSALTQLTALWFSGHALSDLQHAPPQLLQLDLNSCRGELPQLDLHHLSAVTALRISEMAVKEGDVLPPNLLRLRVICCRSAQPLPPLVKLQELKVDLVGTDITADQLRQLSRLTFVCLSYDDFTEPASAGAWPLLPPLRRLGLKRSTLSAPVCQRLAQLSGLTSLAMQLCWLPQAGSAQQLAAALRQLSGLQQLELMNLRWPPATTSEDVTAAGAQQLLQATGSLQRLRELRLVCLPFVAANSSSLAALTALTALSLSNCDLTDAAATAIVSQLPGLQSLDCSYNNGITDAALPAIGRLQQLAHLSLSGTSWSCAGLSQLTSLTRLRVPYHVSAI